MLLGIGLLLTAAWLPSARAQIYVVDPAMGTTGGIAAFSASASGNATPDMTLFGASTGIDHSNFPVVGVVANSTHLFVLCHDFIAGRPFVLKYTLPIVGPNTAPVTTTYLTPKSGGYDLAVALALDSTNLYVLDQGTGFGTAGAINVYPVSGMVAKSSSDPLVAAQTITGTATTMNQPKGLVVHSGSIYVANAPSDNLLVFSTSADGDVAPTKTITGLNGPTAVAVDATTVYTLETGLAMVPTVKSYTLSALGAGASVNGSPATTIASNAFGSGLRYLAIDSNKIYVGDTVDTSDPQDPPTSSILVFDKTTNDGGNATPSTTISGAGAFQALGGLFVLPSAGAPTITGITAGDGQLTVAFTAGAAGGSAITNYKYSIDGGTTFTAVSPATTTSPITITGLTNGTAYQVQLKAVSALGDGAATASTSGTPATTPGAPTITGITAGNGQLTVAFTAGATGGSAITNYKYSTDGGTTFTAVSPATTASPITITGLTNGTAYQVQLKAVNALGDGAATASTSGTPATPPSGGTATATPTTIAYGTVVTLTTTGWTTYGGSTLAQYQWFRVSGSDLIPLGGASASPSVVLANPTPPTPNAGGNVTFRVMVTDSLGQSATADVAVTGMPWSESVGTAALVTSIAEVISPDTTVAVSGVVDFDAVGVIARSMRLQFNSATTLSGTVTVARDAFVTLLTQAGFTVPQVIAQAGSTVVLDRATVSSLVVEGSAVLKDATVSSISVAAGGKLSGVGAVLELLALLADSTVDTGASPGTITAGSGSMAGGVRYIWEINNASGAGGTTDLLVYNNALTLTATPQNPITLQVKTLGSDNQPGSMAGFVPTTSYAWTLMRAGSVAGFNANAFALDTTGFANALQGGSFGVRLSGGEVQLTFTPAPVIPSVSAPTSAAVTASSATLGGNVTADGGAAVTARGIVFAPTAVNGAPRLSGAGVTAISTSGTTGVFTVVAPNLAADTAYSYAAYATNSAGTGYSATGTFATLVANTAPTLGPVAFSGTEDITLTLTQAVFIASYGDAQSDPIASITVVTLPATGTLKLSGTNVTAGQVIPAANLGNLTYVPAANESGGKTFTVTASDGALSSAAATVTMTLAAVNDAPVNLVPGAQTTNANTALVFSTASGNSLGLTDVDAAEAALTVTLTATSGVVALPATTGLTFTTGTGQGDATMTFSGTASSLNAALNGLMFVPAPGFVGSAALAITTSDEGNVGAGGIKTDADTVAITVVDNIAPVVVGLGATVPTGHFKVNATVDVTVAFSEPVLVTVTGGVPTLTLETGTVDRAATYLSGSGTPVLVFRYVVAAGDTSADLDHASTAALQLNGGTIRDSAGNPAVLTLPSTAPGTAGALATEAGMVIDTTAPVLAIGVPSLSSTGSGPVAFVLTYADANFATSSLSNADVTLLKTDTANGTVAVSGSGATRTVTVSGITGNGTLAIAVAAGTATDLAGNVAPAAGPSAVVTVQNTLPLAITSQPVGTAVAVGMPLTLSVAVSGTAPVYQWYRAGVAIAGATNAVYQIAPVPLVAAGDYYVTAENSLNQVRSQTVTVAVFDVTAAHRIVGPGYVGGQELELRHTVTFAGGDGTLVWSLLLPNGWVYARGESEAEVRPALGAAQLLEWKWQSFPLSPVTFSARVLVPAGATGPQSLAAQVTFTRAGVTVPLLARPDPLVAAEIPPHAADINLDGRISLGELVRVIELYNTRYLTARTGAYQVVPGTEDGFAPDLARPFGITAVLSTYHSADTDRDGRLSIFELTRVIELFNFRTGTVRTGEFRRAAGTEDGYAPGPASPSP